MSFKNMSAILKENKLEGQNYVDWKRNMDKILIAENLKFVLTDSCPPFPGQNSTKEVRDAFFKWCKADKLVRDFVLTSLSETYRQLVESFWSAADIMHVLDKFFEMEDQATFFKVARQVLVYADERGISNEDAVQILLEHPEEIECFEESSDSVTQMVSTLSSSPNVIRSDYKKVVTEKLEAFSMIFTILQLEEDSMIDDEFIEAASSLSLSSKEQKTSNGKRKEPESPSTPAESKKGKKSKVKKQTGKCFKCGEKGHWKPDCPRLKKDNGLDNNATSKGEI